MGGRLYVTTRPLFAPRYGGTDLLVELGPYRVRSERQARAFLRMQRCVVIVDATLPSTAAATRCR